MIEWKMFYTPITLWWMNAWVAPSTGTSRKGPEKNQGARASTLSYVDFTIENYKSIKMPIKIPLTEGRLVALLGLNESGKTTVLKALESFDYRNDPKDLSAVKKMFAKVPNKQDIFSNKSAKITASIKIDADIDSVPFWQSVKKKLQGTTAPKFVREEDVHAFFQSLNDSKEIRISRVIPFKKGNPQPTFYEIEGMKGSGEGLGASALASHQDFMRLCAMYIVSLCPYIIYFEDFQDIVPDKIYVSPKSDSFNQDWYDIIDGVFYDTDPDYSVDNFMDLHQKKDPRTTAAITMLQKINKNLDEKFTKQWEDLSKVQDIGSTQLSYDPSGKNFRILIGDKDGTMYDVQERSRGAIWYVSFLMKTEFRRKKMRHDVGKLVYLIDEPASNLHSSAQEGMLRDFGELVQDTCVIYTTHSKHLVSLNNIRTTYVLRKETGSLSCVRLGRYMQSPRSNESYYRPVADHLMIRPHSLDMPCKNVLIVEGPSDMHVLRVMCKIATGCTPDFAIYPAGGANDMAPLISLNLGWGANMRILLDSDQSGNKAKKKYKDQFGLEDSHFVSLPGGASKMEKLFDKEIVKRLWHICQDDDSVDKPNKKHIAQIFARANDEKKSFDAIRKNMDKETVEKFKVFFEKTLSALSDSLD